MQKSFQLRRNRLGDANHSTDARRIGLGQGSLNPLAVSAPSAQPYRPRPSIDPDHCKDMPSEECAALTRPVRFRKAVSVVAPFGRTFSSIDASSFAV